MSLHPAKQINLASCQIVNGEYDEAIMSLTNTLKNLKLIFSGDAKIIIPKEMEGENCDESMVQYHLTSSLSRDFEYDFASSTCSSPFLETVVIVKARNIHRTRILIPTNGRPSSCSSDNKSNRCSSGPQHQLRVSIYRYPIMVKGNNFAAPLDLHVCEELSYVAIYNLALAHHLRAIKLAADPSNQNSRSRQRVYQNLLKAISLYEHAHRSLLLQENTINISVPVIHSMALVINICHIHREMDDHHKAEMCMRFLLSTIMYVIDCGKVERLGTSMDGFFSMIMPLLSEDGPAAAA